MTKQTHTPGPWSASQTARITGDNPGIDVGAADGTNIAQVHYDCATQTPGEVKANARLIAAAPNLLAVCKAVQAALVEEPNGNTAVIGGQMPLLAKRVREALAKVESEVQACE